MQEETMDTTELLISTLENKATEQKSKVQVFKDTLSEDEEKKIEEKAKEFLEFISNKDAGEIRGVLENITIEDIESLENSSELLTTKFSQIDSFEDTASNNVAGTLLKLNSEISDINPHKHNLQSRNILSFIPFIGKPIQRYLKKFKSANEIIGEIMLHLEDGEHLLRDDNTVLQHDKQRYRETAIALQRKAVIFEKVVSSIEANLSKLPENEREFYENNLLLNLHKKIRSIYEILVVTQEGFLSSDLIINTNWELIDNISNVRVVTKRALEIGVAMLVAIENQKNVLDAVEQTKKVTNEMILGNAQRMNTQAAQIYADAGKGTITIETLQEAFNQIDEAMSKINTFKSEAVSKIKNEVGTLKTITHKLEDKIKEAEEIESFKTPISLDV
jgi:uncharacterized protein YaaN involved in tellurite resistance